MRPGETNVVCAFRTEHDRDARREETRAVGRDGAASGAGRAGVRDAAALGGLMQRRDIA
jgi:hypothetical protein